MNSWNRLKKEKSKNSFENLKSNFILKKILENIKKDKSLEIIRYNRKLQKRLNLSINDYKEYYQPIEIELKIEENGYGEFINIPEKEKEYYHIYFNNSNEEIKRNYLNKNEKVKIIKIIIDYKVTSFQKLFYFTYCIESINFKKCYRNNITNMSEMFSHCSSLKEINISNFNAKNVTNMNGMFFYCNSLENLDLSNFNTYNLTDMSEMFSGCSSIKN